MNTNNNINANATNTDINAHADINAAIEAAKANFWDESLDQPFSANETALFFFLLHWARINNSVKPLRIPRAIVKTYLQISDASITRARMGLQVRGLIDFEDGERGVKAPVFFIEGVTAGIANHEAEGKEEHCERVVTERQTIATKRPNEVKERPTEVKEVAKSRWEPKQAFREVPIDIPVKKSEVKEVTSSRPFATCGEPTQDEDQIMELQAIEDRLCSEQNWLLGVQQQMIAKGIPGAESINIFHQLHLFMVKLRQSGIRSMGMFEFKTYFSTRALMA